MGQSTNAILFYGYCWSDEVDGDLTSEERWEISEEGRKEFGVEIGTHCSCDCPMPYIFISESETTARRGFPQRIVMEHPHGQHKWDVQLHDFITKYGISLDKPEYGDAPQGPGWFLVSDWC